MGPHDSVAERGQASLARVCKGNSGVWSFSLVDWRSPDAGARGALLRSCRHDKGSASSRLSFPSLLQQQGCLPRRDTNTTFVVARWADKIGQRLGNRR